MDVGSVNVPYLLVRYLRLFAVGRKSKALISIYMEIDGTWAWVAQGLERQPNAAAGAHKAIEDAPAVDDDMPQAVPPPPRTQDFSMFVMWTVTSLTWMMDRAGVAYPSYSETPGEYQRHTRRRTGEASTDISKITRKSSKMGKHGHEKRKSTREAKDSKPKPRKVNPWVNRQIKLFIGQVKQGITRGLEKAQGKMGFYTILTLKRSTDVSITDCHAGNPCEIVCDPRVLINSPMIRRSYGYDKKERVEQGKPRTFSLWL
ncbi:hypothetical protein Tco_1412828 [Tanacetum coccineum]